MERAPGVNNLLIFDMFTVLENTFDQLMKAARVCSLGQISASLYDVGGQYRRNM
jgi:hypothetical protein